MGLRTVLRATVVALAVALYAGAAAADRMVVAGRSYESRAPFVAAAGDVFVPLLTALEPLAASPTLTLDTIKITTRAGREILISRQRPEATLDGMLRALPARPKQQGDVLLLPAKAVGSMLGCAVRWDGPTRTVYLHPWVRKFTVELAPDCYRVVIASEHTLTYHADKMDQPPRLVIDLLNTDLADIPSAFAIESSYFKMARIAQRSLSPDKGGDVTRVVIELSEWRPYRLRVSEDRCRLEVELPLPGAELPSDAPPVTLTDLTCRRYSAHLTAITLSLTGQPRFKAGDSANSSCVWVDIENAGNQIKADKLVLVDRLISKVSLTAAPGRRGVQRLTLDLTEPTPYAVACDNGTLRVLLGRCELSDLTVVVDAGHGGGDPGAVGRSGLTEKEVNLDLAVRVTQLLEAAGAKVVLTRGDDDALRAFGSSVRRDQLLARCNVANAAFADLFVSLHCNARGEYSAGVRGTETYYRKLDSLSFARVMQEEMVAALGIPDGGAHYHPKSIIVLYRTEMPAVLVEVAYLSNPEDEALLATSEFRDQAAQGVANGVKRYVQESDLLSLLTRRQQDATALESEAGEGE